MARIRLIWVLLVALAVSACGSVGSASDVYRRETSAPAQEASGAFYLDAPAPSPSPLAATEAKAAGEAAAVASRQPDGSQTRPPGQAQPRLRIYTGYMEIVVNEVERVRERVVDVAGQLGGYVESTTAEYVVVRVPAERLEEAMRLVSELGELRARSVETSDVTEEYADLGRRIEVERKTRDRLYALLERTTDVEERVRILREIRRLTEDIESMTSALSVLSEQIKLSRLTVRLIPRMEQGAEGTPRIPFPWIARLQPLNPSGGRMSQPLGLKLPAEYAVFESTERVRAEAADGTRLSVGAVSNSPGGDTMFWSTALKWHLGQLYRTTEALTAGSFQGAVFESKDIVPYHYLVAVAVRGDQIVLAEAFFPDAASRERRLEGIRGVLEGWKP